MGWSKRVQHDVTVWNEHLRNKVTIFQSHADDSTLLLFSSHAFFRDLLDEPVKYGFVEEDTKMSGGAIWFDGLHPTSKVHEALAKQIYLSIFDHQDELNQ
jgi:phospholipase/lecithinase/hemolysin